MLAIAIAIAIAIAACGARAPAGDWVEHDTRGTAIHADVPTVARAAQPATLDPATIDTLDEPAVRSALERTGDAAPAGRLALRGARLAWHRGDAALARSLIARGTSAADRATVATELAALAAQAAEPRVDSKTIAVVLPLSGRFAGIGNELKAAVQLAPAHGTSWLFLDTRGEPDGAVAAIEQAVARGAAGILGPVGEREAVAAARAAALHGIPIALLAPADGADPAAGVFRVVDSPGDEARAVARLAADEGFPTVAVFAPRDDVGQAAAAAFVVEANRLDLQVTRQGAYDPTGGNLEPDIKQFLDLVPARNPRLAEHLAHHGRKGWVTFSPEINYSLLYIPDRYDRAALVAAFLPYFGVELRTQEFPDLERLRRKHGGVIPQVVQLVGGAGWHHPSLAIRGGAAVQGALLLDAFPGELGGDAGVALIAAFRQRTNRTPSAAAAETYDAATLIARARNDAASAVDVRGALRANLAHGKLDDGACGPAAMGSDGELVREPAVLEVVGDQLVLAP